MLPWNEAFGSFAAFFLALTLVRIITTVYASHIILAVTVSFGMLELFGMNACVLTTNDTWLAAEAGSYFLESVTRPNVMNYIKYNGNR